jgi:hypothetical protein
MKAGYFENELVCLNVFSMFNEEARSSEKKGKRISLLIYDCVDVVSTGGINC